MRRGLLILSVCALVSTVALSADFYDKAINVPVPAGWETSIDARELAVQVVNTEDGVARVILSAPRAHGSVLDAYLKNLTLTRMYFGGRISIVEEKDYAMIGDKTGKLMRYTAKHTNPESGEETELAGRIYIFAEKGFTVTSICVARADAFDANQTAFDQIISGYDINSSLLRSEAHEMKLARIAQDSLELYNQFMVDMAEEDVD